MVLEFESEALESGYYDMETGALTLVVKGKERKDGTRNRKQYTYLNVPVIVVNNLDGADSAGRFWIKQIIPFYKLAA